jgi:hypothetical protein
MIDGCNWLAISTTSVPPKATFNGGRGKSPERFALVKDH